MAKKGLVVFALSAVVSGVVTLSNPALAKWRNVPASACLVVTGDTSGLNYAGGVRNDSTSSYVTMYCPVPSDSYLPQSTIVGATINGYDNTTTGQTCMAACRAYLDDDIGTCTTSSCSSYYGTGAASFTITPSSLWSSDSDYGYVQISIPPRTTSVGSSVNGVHFADSSG
jgi:hypothetical protein